MNYINQPPLRVAICTNFISPYRVPVFRRFVEITGWHLRIITNTEMEPDRDWSISDSEKDPFEVRLCTTVSRKHRSDTGISCTRYFPTGLPGEIIRYKPDAIITGELGPRTAIAMATGALIGAKVIPWTYNADPSPKRFGLDLFRQFMARNSSAIIGMGDRARRTLESNGCESARIHNAPNAADTEAICTRRQQSAHAAAVLSIHKRFSNKKIAVAVGRMIKAKSIQLIVDAWINMPLNIRSEWKLIFIGSGPEQHNTEGLESFGIHAIGSVSPAEITDWMTAADLHVFGSIADPWGLVVNEAMHCGTPTLCSIRAGCCDDLVEDGLTGFTFDPLQGQHHTIAALTRAMTSGSLAAVGNRARAHVAHFTPANMAQGMVDAVNSALCQVDTCSWETSQ